MFCDYLFGFVIKFLFVKVIVFLFIYIYDLNIIIKFIYVFINGMYMMNKKRRY